MKGQPIFRVIRIDFIPDRSVLEIFVRRIYVYLSLRLYGEYETGIALVPSTISHNRMVSFFESGIEYFLEALRDMHPLRLDRSFTPPSESI